jgi:serine phosphatase RsbU (regulator of sigma subunit)
MTRRLPTPLVLTLAFLVLLVGLLLAGGLLVRSILTESFSNAEHIQSARVLVATALRAQLDEESGVRGYSAVHDPLLLQPYYEGRRTLPGLLRGTRTVIERLGVRDALPYIVDAAATNRRWLVRVASRLLVARKRTHVLELRGKVLADRFRADIGAVDQALVRREVLGDARAQRAIIWANFFALAAVLAVAAAAALFTVQEYRLGVRLEQERAEAEEQRRRTAELRAAYDAEKRIADTLQAAFAQRVLPDMPTVRLSATYVPATEEAKIGGDWYDALQLSQDRMLLAIGDVAGHGIDAAVAMNKTRQMLISYALIDPTPGRVLERVNTELVTENSPMITAVTGLIDADTCQLSYAVAGHPAPVLLEPGRRARFLKAGSLPLGIDPNTSYATHLVQIAPGAMLVLYTDGAIEYSHDVLEGETLLLQAIESAVQNHEDDPATAIRVGIFSRHRVSDDVAILTVHFLEPDAARDVSEASALRRSA